MTLLEVTFAASSHSPHAPEAQRNIAAVTPPGIELDQPSLILIPEPSANGPGAPELLASAARGALPITG